MADFDFQVSILNTFTGKRLGSGPIPSVTRWKYTPRMSRAGTFEFEMVVNDPQGAYVLHKRLVKCEVLMGGQWVEFGIGVIDKIDIILGNDGRATIRCSGMDLVGELGRWNMKDLELGAGTGITLEDALATIQALEGPWAFSWTFVIDSAVPIDFLHAKFAGQSVLGALIYLAEKTGMQFYRGEFRTLHFTSVTTDSGIRIVRGMEEMGDDAYAIVNLSRSVETFELLTRVYPYGSGQDKETSLTLSAATLAMPTGYVMNTVLNFIENLTATTEFGLVDYPDMTFKEIAPISNTNADYQAASNMLAASALAELQRRSTIANQTTFTTSVENCNRLVKPMQRARLTVRDIEQGIDFDDSLIVLEASWEADERGLRMAQLTVSTEGRWPKGSGQNAADRAIKGEVFKAYPQIALNEWWENAALLVGDHQINKVAEFPFVLGRSIVTIQRVVVRLKVDQALGVVKSYSYASNSTNQPSVDDTSNADWDDAGQIDGDFYTGGALPSTLTGGNSQVPTSLDVNHTGSSTAANTGDVASPTTGVNSVASGAPSYEYTGTKSPTHVGNPVIAGELIETSGPMESDYTTTEDYTETNYDNVGEMSNAPALETWTVDHQSHTHPIPEHVHRHYHLHTSLLPNHEHLDSHTHIIGHTHGFQHNHTMGHYHRVDHVHDHTHDHSFQHVHDRGHVHPMPHTHILPTLVEQTTVDKVPAIESFTELDLEYAVNGGAWASVMSVAVGTGDGYFEIDITEDVTHPTIPFRPAQESGNNRVEFRCNAANVDNGKSAMILTKLGVRVTIRGVAIT